MCSNGQLVEFVYIFRSGSTKFIVRASRPIYAVISVKALVSYSGLVNKDREGVFLSLRGLRLLTSDAIMFFNQKHVNLVELNNIVSNLLISGAEQPYYAHAL